MSGATQEVDVVVFGGAFAGASSAILLRRENPALRVLVIERAARFDRKVGEATTEVSGAFLSKRLGIFHHLIHHHIVKQGLRFWFTKNDSDTLETAGELGPNFQVRMPSFQVDRKVLDEYLLNLAAHEGAQIARPATVANFDLNEPGGRATVTIESNQGRREVSARWVIDATGRAAKIARAKGLLQKVPEHPTNALWARFRGVQDMDSDTLRRKYPGYARRVHVSRSAATNHLCGYGWWCWMIPLKGGDMSVGLVYDERLFTPPEGRRIGERLLAHLHAHPLGRELFSKAVAVEGDERALSGLPYFSQCIAGSNWSLVGDAAGFMDPLYSSGMDFGAWTISMAVDRILAEARGEPVCLESLNARWRASYRGWFEAVYLDKYYYLGDRELMTAAYLMDLGMFFFGPVREIVHCTRKGFANPPFCGTVDVYFAKLMRFYNKRLAELARQKHAAGMYGNTNSGVCRFVPGFTPTSGIWRYIFEGARIWLLAELRMVFQRLRTAFIATKSLRPKITRIDVAKAVRTSASTAHE
jgi:flavin-dependent dehydrogenase